MAGLGKSKPILLESLLLNIFGCTPGHQNLAAPVTSTPNSCLWPRTACKTRCKLFYSTSHCLPHPPGTAELPRLFVWEARQGFRAGGCAKQARAARCELYRKLATLGLTPHEWGFAKNELLETCGQFSHLKKAIVLGSVDVQIE
eukprot:1155918-Pelagomonas_calceolata.AAC.3